MDWMLPGIAPQENVWKFTCRHRRFRDGNCYEQFTGPASVWFRLIARRFSCGAGVETARKSSIQFAGNALMRRTDSNSSCLTAGNC